MEREGQETEKKKRKKIFNQLIYRKRKGKEREKRRKKVKEKKKVVLRPSGSNSHISVSTGIRSQTG